MGARQLAVRQLAAMTKSPQLIKQWTARRPYKCIDIFEFPLSSSSIFAGELS